MTPISPVTSGTDSEPVHQSAPSANFCARWGEGTTCGVSWHVQLSA